MIATPLDPTHVPVLNLTGEEIAEIRAQIAAGALPADWLDRHADAVARNVFGHDAKRDRHGAYEHVACLCATGRAPRRRATLAARRRGYPPPLLI
jgi:hypothetical protein